MKSEIEEVVSEIEEVVTEQVVPEIQEVIEEVKLKEPEARKVNKIKKLLLKPFSVCFGVKPQVNV